MLDRRDFLKLSAASAAAPAILMSQVDDKPIPSSNPYTVSDGEYFVNDTNRACVVIDHGGKRIPLAPGRRVFLKEGGTFIPLNLLRT